MRQEAYELPTRPDDRSASDVEFLSNEPPPPISREQRLPQELQRLIDAGLIDAKAAPLTDSRNAPVAFSDWGAAG